MKKKIVPFMCGVLTSAVLVSTVFAGTGYVGRFSFNTNSLYLNGHEILTAGESMITDKGAEVPSSILYTDEHGGGTYYVPVRPLAHALEMPATWEEDAILWKVKGDLAVNLLSISGDGAIFNDYIQEVTVVIPEDGNEIVSAEHNAVENYEAELELSKNKGNTVSITVTNYGSANLVFSLGVKRDDNVLTSPTKVPAGQTVTRTFRVLSEDTSGAVPYINIGNADDTFHKHNFAVQVARFDVEYETSQPDKVEKEFYPRTADGKTYGKLPDAQKVGYLPDLIMVIGEQGNSGYITKEDHDIKGDRYEKRTVPVYDLNGNIIDSFTFESSDDLSGVSFPN